MIALLTIIFSFIGALICGLMPACAHRRIRWVALLTAGLGLAAAFCCALRYTGPGMEDVISRTWIPSMGVGFLTGFDGISLPLLLVTGLVAVAGVLFTWKLDHRANQFYAFYFALIGGVYGVFLSMDLFLLFVFYEIAIVPKYFLIAIWGGAKREYAAMKLVMYSFGGSALVLIGMLALFFASGLNTFDLRALMTVDFSSGLQAVVFPVMFVGFAILAGMWPFHTWAPQGHSAAPTAASMLLAGVVMKLGAYGCLRVAVGLMPEGAMVWAPWVAVFAVINIIYGALAALRQDDFKYVIGYSSVSHMGFVLLGVAAVGSSAVETSSAGLNGAALQMFTHGTITGLAFLMVGLSYDRTHTRHIPHLGGLWKKMPLIAIFFLVAGFGSLGLPALSGFVAEIMVFLGTFSVWPWATGVAAFGVVLAAGYTLWMVQRVFFGDRPAYPGLSDEVYDNLTDANWIDMIPVIALAAPIFIVGIWPSVVTDMFDIGIQAVLR